MTVSANTLKTALRSFGHDISDDEAKLVAQEIDDLEHLDHLEAMDAPKARDGDLVIQFRDGRIERLPGARVSDLLGDD